MKKSRLLCAVCAAVVGFITMSANAALIGVLPATPGGTDWQAYYDEDADLTWLADADAARTSRSWTVANTWAATLDIDGVTGWRLPSSLNSDGSGPCFFVNCTDSEMGNLYYNVLGNAAFFLTNTGPFSNVQPYYWSSTEYAPDTNFAWNFHFFSGLQDEIGKIGSAYMWAVHSGDVSAVPIPASVWLFGTGLLGLIGIARRKKA